MFRRIVQGALEPLGNSNKRFQNIERRLHISVSVRSDKILQNQNSILNENIVKIRNKNAKKMLEQLSMRNPYIGNNKTNFISEFIKEQKNNYPNRVILLQNGSKYEAFETDSIVLAEYCDLEFVGNTPQVEVEEKELNKIGQKMMKEGIEVNVYEEVVKGTFFTENQKTYKLSKVYTNTKGKKEDVTPENLNIDVEIIRNNIQSKVVGLGYEGEGYSMSIIDMKGKVDIFYNLSEICVTDVINKIKARVIILQDNSAKIRSVFKNLVNVIHYHIIQGGYMGSNFHMAILQEIATRLNLEIEFKINRFRDINSVEIRKELGEVGMDNFNYLDNNIINYMGDFYESVVFSNSPSYVKRYFKQLLCKNEVGQSEKIREVNKMLSELRVPLIQIKNVYNIENINVENLVSTVNTFKYYVDHLPEKLNMAVLELVKNDLKININYKNLKRSFEMMYKVIYKYIREDYTGDVVSGYNERINKVNTLEKTDKGSLISVLLEKQKSKKMIKEEYVKDQLEVVQESLNKLLYEIYIKYINCKIKDKLNIKEYINKFNVLKDVKVKDNIVYVTDLKKESDHVKMESIQMVEKNRIIQCYMNKEINNKLWEYINECNILNYKVGEVLITLQRKLEPYKQIIELMLNWIVTLQSLNDHVSYGLSKGWSLIKPTCEERSSIKIDGSVSIVEKGILTENNNKNVILVLMLSNLGLYSPCREDSKVSVYEKYYCYKEQEEDHNYVINMVNNTDCSTVVVLNRSLRGDDMGKLLNKKATIILQRPSYQDATSTIEFENYNNKLINTKVPKINGYKDNDSNNQSDTISGNSNIVCQEIGEKEKEEIEKVLKRVWNKDLKERMRLVASILVRLTEFRPERDMVYLGHNQVPPPRFTCVPVTYILFMKIQRSGRSRESRGAFGGAKFAVYVGETGDVTTRLNKHKTKAKVNLNDYLQSQFINYNQDLNQYLIHLRDISKKSEVMDDSNESIEGIEQINETDDMEKNKSNEEMGLTKGLNEIDFGDINVLLLRLKSRKESRVMEKNLIQQMYNYPNQFLLLSRRDGHEFTIPYLD